MEDCQKKAAGKPEVSKSPRGADPKPKGKGKGGKGKKGASSLDEWPDGQENPPSDEKAPVGGHSTEMESLQASSPRGVWMENVFCGKSLNIIRCELC